MTDIILHGCNGAMGRVIVGLAENDPDVRIVAGIDITGEKKDDFPVFKSLSDCDIKGDVIVDFSVASAIDALLGYASEKKLPIVLCTTGLSNEQLSAVKEASYIIPILKSANMSLGVNTLFKLAKVATGILSDQGYDIEIVERHHNRKLDAPSGTAVSIADAVNEAAGGRYSYRLDRSSVREKRKKDEIGIQAVRGGSIVGEHELLFCGPDEVIEIKHTAYSRAIFGKGALTAAKFLKTAAPGMYDMSDVLNV